MGHKSDLASCLLGRNAVCERFRYKVDVGNAEPQLQGVALIKSVYGVICMRDPTYFLFAGYGLIYFAALLPSKLFALLTVSVTVSLQFIW